MLIKLQYITNRGFEWFEKEVTVTEDNYKSVIDNYVKDNEKSVKQIVKKWESDGEMESLELDFDILSNTTEEIGLRTKVWNYIYH
jgi:hypothetical protein